MAPVINCSPGQVMGAFADPRMFTQDLSFRGDDNPLRVSTHADRPIGEGDWHAVAFALQVNETGRRHAFGVLDEAVKRPRRRHEVRCFLRPDIGDGSRQEAVSDLLPQFDAAPFQPGVQGVHIRKGRRRLP